MPQNAELYHTCLVQMCRFLPEASKREDLPPPPAETAVLARQGSPRMQPYAPERKGPPVYRMHIRVVHRLPAPRLHVSKRLHLHCLCPPYTPRAYCIDHRLPPPRLHVFTLRAIALGEELCWDYGEEYWDTMGKRGKLKL